MQNGSFHSWINVWVAGKTKLCEARAIQPRVAPLVTVKSSVSVGRCAFIDARKITSGHAVFNAEVEKEIECRSHQDEPVRFYCDDCDTCVCVLCTFHAHRGHRVMSFHDAAARQRAVVLGLLERCRRRIDNVDELVGALNGCDKLVSETTQTIHDIASAFIQVSRPRFLLRLSWHTIFCANWFYPRDAVLALCPFVCLSVCHKSEFYQNDLTERARFCHICYPQLILHCKR